MEQVPKPGLSISKPSHLQKTELYKEVYLRSIKQTMGILVLLKISGEIITDLFGICVQVMKRPMIIGILKMVMCWVQPGGRIMKG